ncbi:hypothetical protein FDP08_02180 [Marinobacter panjinensis]|uniref:Uncharacterized protein n=1 Tax=Marinobacter panjinensis TaxID=2576384 RepID=A0A4U6R042_9GAMM|nr:hypothetical protein [Marinobacter panjinensis]TKV66977.1 hypothetical protein FDP08_02180 [Marinobacter panjinensis]
MLLQITRRSFRINVASLTWVFLLIFSPNVFSQDGDASSETEQPFDQLLSVLRNLNAYEPFANSNDYDAINSIVSEIEAVARDSKESPKFKEEKLTELRDILAKRRTEFLESIRETGEDVLSEEYRKSILDVCNFDPAAQDALDNEIRAIASLNDRADQERAAKRLLAPNKQCEDTLLLVATSLDDDIAKLSGEIDVLDRRVEELRSEIEDSPDDSTREEKQKKLQGVLQERERKKQIIEKKKKVRGEIDVGLLLSGIANIAVGFAITVFSGGTLWPVVGQALMSGGAAMVGKSLEPLLKHEEVTEREVAETGKYERSVNDAHEPSDIERRKASNSPAVRGYSNISPDQNGNFAVYQNVDGSIKVVQVEPFKVVATIPHDFPTTAGNEYGISNLSGVAQMKVTDISDVRTRITIRFTGRTSDGKNLTGALIEHSQEPGFLLAFE